MAEAKTKAEEAKGKAQAALDKATATKNKVERSNNDLRDLIKQIREFLTRKSDIYIIFTTSRRTTLFLTLALLMSFYQRRAQTPTVLRQ